MTILALEFSSARRSVALARGPVLLAEAVEEAGGRGTSAFGLIQEVLERGNSAREEISVVAVGLGPGSYTGIRAAIAIAQGWQLARGTKLVGVSSMDSMAEQASTGKIFGRVCVAVDAQRGEFYLSGWEISPMKYLQVESLKIISAAEMVARKAAGEMIWGPEMDLKLFPTAPAVAALAVGRTDFIAGEELAPIYLRETSFLKAPVGRVV